MTMGNTQADHPRQRRSRRWFFQIHLWTGLFAAIYVAVASISGSALVFREELVAFATRSPRVDPSRGEVSISPDAAAVALERAVPGYRLGALVMPERAGEAYGGYLLKDGRFAFARIHPVSGGIVDTVTPENSIWRWLEDLHNNLLSGRTGRVVNGAGGVSLLLLCITGLVIRWPGRAGWRRAFHLDWRSRWPRFLWDLHGALGVWMLPIVFIVSLTGVYHTWPQWFRSAVSLAAPVASRERPLTFPASRDQRTVSISRLLASAEAALPGRQVRSLQFPADRTQAIRAVMPLAAEPLLTQADAVLLHPSTARAVRVERHAGRPAGDRFLRWLPPLHSGRFAGGWSKLLWFMTGIAMAALALTGQILWWNRVIRKRLLRELKNRQ